MIRRILPACSLLLLASLAPACSSAPTDEATAETSTEELRALTAAEVVGDLALGATSAPVAYSEKPLYRAFRFVTTAAKTAVDLKVHAPGVDAQAWLLGSRFQTIASNDDAASDTRDSRIQRTLYPGTYYIAFREKNREDSTFTVSLNDTTPPAAAPMTFTLAGNAAGTTPFYIDDNVVLKVNGQEAYRSPGGSQTLAPVSFTAKLGDTVRVELYDTFGVCLANDALWLSAPGFAATEVLPATPQRCSTAASPNVPFQAIEWKLGEAPPAPPPSPWDASSCAGPSITYAEALSRFAPAGTHAELGRLDVRSMKRTCNDVTGCAAWAEVGGLVYWKQENQYPAPWTQLSLPLPDASSPSSVAFDVEAPRTAADSNIALSLGYVNHGTGFGAGRMNFDGVGDGFSHAYAGECYKLPCSQLNGGKQSLLDYEVTERLVTKSCLRIVASTSVKWAAGHDEYRAVFFARY